ncbi:asparaginase [Halomarina rubra]|uniref:L-asparaginase n=1 Tax=Halomarina rubra TaxID=2071873 RepID=A0ABD6AX29_9EURY|nr:asparaginase [Halomarina rubra]
MTTTLTVLGTGGTIASTDGDDGATPSKRSEELVEAVPELTDVATIEVREVTRTPSFDMDLETLDELRDAVEDATETTDGVLITHGTDTMEESAYYLDLTLDVDVPVVFTGAQRRPDELSADGPANLLTAARTLTDERIATAGGVYVAFDEELHAARDVTKRHTRKLNAFASPETGPVATVTRDAVRLHREPGSYSATFDVDAPTATVRVVPSGVGVDRGPIDDALDTGVDGIVLEGTGLGNTTAALGDAVDRAISGGVPVVVTSRCYAGPTLPVYGTAGGGRRLEDHGAVHADDLPAQKARLKLVVALDQADDPSDVTTHFSGTVS